MARETLGARIRRARQRAGLEQQDLADAVGVSLRTIGNWENDRSTPRNRLPMLEDVLGKRLDDEPDRRQVAIEDLRRGVVNADGLAPEERQAMLDAMEEILARKPGESASSEPAVERGDGSARFRPASL